MEALAADKQLMGALTDVLATTVVTGTMLVLLLADEGHATGPNKEAGRGKTRVAIPNGYEAQSAEEQRAIDAYDERQRLPGLLWLWRNVRPKMAAYLVAMHFLAAFGLPRVAACERATLGALLVLYFLSCFGITAGSHRLWSHRSYKAALPFRVVVMLCASLANQGTVLHWSRDHRTHHKYSETKADPHNALRGFFFAHIGWLFVEKDPRVAFAGRRLCMDDLTALPELALQRALDPGWNLFWCFGFPTLLATRGWGEDASNAFLVLGALRYVLCLHATWLVNSAAHLFGSRPYAAINPAENRLVALLSIGEGWHNWHHAFPYDYAASELGVSSQFNPTKLLIDAAARIGLVWGRRRATSVWQRRAAARAAPCPPSGPPLFRLRRRAPPAAAAAAAAAAPP